MIVTPLRLVTLNVFIAQKSFILKIAQVWLLRIFRGLGELLPDNEFKYTTITWENNTALSGVNFEYSYQTTDSFPTPEEAPNLVSAYLYYPYAMSGDMNISQYTSLSTFLMRYAPKVKNLICQGNRKIYRIECNENYAMERMTIQNCPSLYRLYGYQDRNNNMLEYFTAKNCANLRENESVKNFV